MEIIFKRLNTNEACTEKKVNCANFSNKLMNIAKLYIKIFMNTYCLQKKIIV